MMENEPMQQQTPEGGQGEGVQPQQQGQGTPPESDEPQQQGQESQGQQQQSEVSQQNAKLIDYEKAYKNLEKDYTRKSQKLAEIEKWEEFQKQTGITAEQALQQLEYYRGNTGSEPQPQGPPMDQTVQDQPYQQRVNPYQPGGGGQPFQQNDPRVSQLERELQQLKRGQQIEQLRQRFPQFDELYPDVVNTADQHGLDLETAFGRVLVDKWEDVMGQQKQQVVNNIRQKQSRQVEPSQAPESNHDPVSQLSNEEIQAAKAMGLDPKEYAQAKEGLSID